MELIHAINSRTCVRSFQERTPERELIDSLLKAATRAPSAGNLQPWRFFVVWGKGARRKLAKAAMGQQHVGQAPVVVVICVDPLVSGAKYGSRGRDLYCIQDGSAAAENLLLAAVAHGLGGCWVGAFDEIAAARVIGAPAGLRPIIMVPLGFPAGPLASTPRVNLERVVKHLV